MKRFVAAIAIIALAAIAVMLAMGREPKAPPPAASAAATTVPAASAGAPQSPGAAAASPGSVRPGMPGPQAARVPASEYEDRYRKGDSAWLLAHARSAPENGSYTFALKALSPCLTLIRRGTQEQQSAALEASEPDAALRGARRLALQAMFARCANLPNAEALRTQLNALQAERAAAHDAVYMAESDMPGIAETRIPKDARQKRLADMLAMNDASVATMVKELFVRPGFALEGEVISPQNLVAYQAAWSLALCGDYGECLGPGSVESHEKCLYRGDCEYLDNWQVVERELPANMSERARDYYSRIHDNISRRNFAAFGVN